MKGLGLCDMGGRDGGGKVGMGASAGNKHKMSEGAKGTKVIKGEKGVIGRIRGWFNNIFPPVENSWIAGFWRRLFAFIVDFSLIFALGLISSLFLADFYADLGLYGRFVGFFVAMIYFAVLNSKIGNGQTFGKKLFNIRVVDKDNNLISLPRSILRYLVLGIIFFLNGAILPDILIFSFWKYIIALILFGGFFASVYLYIFNRATRQTLHDLIAKTYVVNIDRERIEPAIVAKIHYYIVGLIFLFSAFIPAFTDNLAQKAPFTEMISAREIIMQEEKVRYAGVNIGWSKQTSKKGTKQINYVSANIIVKDKNINDSKLARKIAQIIYQNIAQAKERDVIAIRLNYGFDIGVASKWNFRTFYFEPEEVANML